jgi:hypothetical protein
MADTSNPDVEAIITATAGLAITPGTATSRSGLSAESSSNLPPDEPMSSASGYLSGHKKAKSMAKFSGDGERINTPRHMNSAALELPKDQISTLEKLFILRRAEQYS